MMTVDPAYIKGKYKLHMLRELENVVAEAVGIQVPFNNPITGFCALCVAHAHLDALTSQHPQGRHSRQGHPCQSLDVRDPQPAGLWPHALHPHRLAHHGVFTSPTT